MSMIEVKNLEIAQEARAGKQRKRNEGPNKRVQL